MGSSATGPFAGLDEQALRSLCPQGAARTCAKNVIVVSAGDSTDSLYVILSGRVKAFVSDEQGKEVVVNTIGAGDFFGELVLDGGPRVGLDHDARALPLLRHLGRGGEAAAGRAIRRSPRPDPEADRQGALAHRPGARPGAQGRLRAPRQVRRRETRSSATASAWSPSA